MDVYGVLAAGGVEKESDVVACSGLGGGGSEDGKRILVFGIAAFGMRDGAFDFKTGDGLKGIVLWEGDPEMAGLCVGVGGYVDLVSEAEATLGVDGARGKRFGVEKYCRG